MQDEPRRPPTLGSPHDVSRCFATCFSNSSGAITIDHLKRLFLDRRIAASASTSELWHLEGQRSVVAHIMTMVERGRRAPTQGLSHDLP